jgi:hypothetical protein
MTIRLTTVRQADHSLTEATARDSRITPRGYTESG